MAQFAIHGSRRSVAALASLIVFLGMLAYAVAGGLDRLPVDGDGVAKRVQYGLATYLVCIVAIALGFWSKEDVIAVLGILGFALLIVLDIILRVGVLSFNMI